MTRKFITLLILLIGVESQATTYYIDFASGNDANAGTSKDAPWKKAPGMVGFAGAYAHVGGDRFVFKGGVTWTSCWPMNVAQSGTSNGTRDYYGVDQTWYAGGSWTRPIFDFGNVILGSGITGSGVYTINTSNLIFDGLDLANHRAQKRDYGAMSLALYGGNMANITVTNCVMRDWDMPTPIGNSDDSNGTGGVQFFWSGVGNWISNALITHCIFHQANAAVKTGVCVRNLTPMEFCEVYQTVNGYLGGGWIHHNNFHHMTAPSDPYQHCNAIEVFVPSTINNNWIHDLDNAESPINCIPDWAGAPGGICRLYNNIMYNLGAQIPIALDSGGAAPGTSGVEVYNNTIEHSTYTVKAFVRPGVTTYGTLIVRNNHFISDMANPVGYNNLAIGLANITSATVDNNLIQTPAVAAAAGYTYGNAYRPVDATKPTVDTGLNLSAIFTTAHDDNIRSVPWDKGAFEFIPGGAPSPGTIVLDTATYSVNETNASVIVTAHRTGGNAGAVSCAFATADGTAIQSINYTSTNGTFLWSDGDVANKTVTVGIINASMSENKVFGLGISSATGGAVIGTPDTATITVIGNAPPSAPILTGWDWAATNGVVALPFSITDDYVDQSVQTIDPAQGGSLRFTFTNSVEMVCSITIEHNSPGDGNNSLFIDVNTEPTSPAKIFDAPVTSGFATNTVTLRGLNGDAYDPEFTFPTWTIPSGTNVVIIRGRESLMRIRRVTLVPVVAASIVQVSSTVLPGHYKAGSSIPIVLTCSGDATVSGAPTLPLNSGGTATYSSGSGTTNLTFAYTVQAGETSVKLDYTATNALNLSGGSITVGGQGIDTTLPVPGAAGSIGADKTIVVDTTAPTITLTTPYPASTRLGPVTYTVNYSDTNFRRSTISTNNITLITESGNATGVVSVSAYDPGISQVVTISGITGKGRLRISVAAGTAEDYAGNVAPAESQSSSAVVGTLLNVGQLTVGEIRTF